VGTVGAGIIYGHLVFERRNARNTFGSLALFLGFFFFLKRIVPVHFRSGTSFPRLDDLPWMLISVFRPCGQATSGRSCVGHEVQLWLKRQTWVKNNLSLEFFLTLCHGDTDSLENNTQVPILTTSPSMPAPFSRQQHNPHQLKCTHGCEKWFKTAGGRTRHVRSSHNAKATLHRRSLTNHSSDAAIQSSPPPDDAISYAFLRNFQDSPRSNLSLFDVPHGDIPPMFDDPFFNDDPPLNEPFDVRSPERSKSPLDEICIHHPLINGMYTLKISCAPMLKM